VDGGAYLPDGTYIDAPDGQAHYVLTLSAVGGGFKGSITYLSASGSTATAFDYQGVARADRTVDLTTSVGRTYGGTFTLHKITLNRCADYLPWANPRQTNPLSCSFRYNGHIP
jgi:hypothetical protein